MKVLHSLLLLLACSGSAHSFYLPGVAPQDFKKVLGEPPGRPDAPSLPRCPAVRCPERAPISPARPPARPSPAGAHGPGRDGQRRPWGRLSRRTSALPVVRHLPGAAITPQRPLG
jgi:hypothetical protein